MSKIIEKHRLKLLENLITFYWWCDEILENIPSHKTGTSSKIFFDPISGTAILVSLAVSAASLGTQLLIQKLLAPKPKPQVKGKLTGEVSITDSIFGAEKIRVHGRRPANDDRGGVELGANIIWLPEIRKIETTTQTGGGGGKGGPRSTPTTTITYICDLAAAFGEGEQRLLRLKFNDDTVYTIGGTGIEQGPAPTRYEAEAGANILTGTAAVAADTECSNGQKVTGLGSLGTLTLTGIVGELAFSEEEPPVPGENSRFKFNIFYKSSGDTQAYVKLNGTGGVYTFPDTGGDVGQKTVIRDFAFGENELLIYGTGASGPEIDCVDVSTVLFAAVSPTGVRDDGFPAESAQDNILIPDPKGYDTNPFERFNSVPVTDSFGVVEFTLPSGANAAWYPGTEDQPIDPVIQAQVDTAFGAGFTPAFRGTPFLRVQNLDISKYGGVPQIRALVESAVTGDVAEICLAEAKLCGLDETDCDFSDGDGLTIRGSHGTKATDFFEMCALIHNLSFVESADGKQRIKKLGDRTPVATIPYRDLGAYVADDQPEPPDDDIVCTVTDPTELIRSMELQFYNPLAPSDFATDRVSYTYPYTPSTRSESKSVNATLLPEEAQKVVARLLQNDHLKKGLPYAFQLPYNWCWLDAGDTVSVETSPGNFQKLRLEEKTGSAPGVYDCTAYSEDMTVAADEVSPNNTSRRLMKTDVGFPANSIGTIIDIPALIDAQEGKPGVYVAACKKPGYGVWKGCGVYRTKAGETALQTTLERECSMGRTVTALGSIPALTVDNFDTSNVVHIEFYNDFTPSTVPEGFAEEGANSFVIGDEVVVIMTWVRDTAYPNRWIGSNIYRTLRNTDGKDTGHSAGERVVFLNDAVKFIPLDRSERDIERTWKFVTTGQAVDDAAPIAFKWQAQNLYNRAAVAPVIGQVFDAETLEIRVGVRGFTSAAIYRKILVSLASDMSDALETIVEADEFPASVLPADFVLTRPAGKTANETFYVQIAHSSNGWEFGELSNVLEVTFADSSLLGGSAGGFAPYQDYAVEVIT